MHRFPPSKLTANARQRFAEMSVVTGPHWVPLASLLSGTITGNRPRTVARAHSFTINFKAIF